MPDIVTKKNKWDWFWGGNDDKKKGYGGTPIPLSVRSKYSPEFIAWVEKTYPNGLDWLDPYTKRWADDAFRQFGATPTTALTTTTPTSVTQSNQRVESMNGYDFLMGKDENGNDVVIETLGRTQTGGNADAQAVLNNYAKNANFQNMLSWGAQNQNLESRAIQQQMADQYERERASLMGKFTGSPRDWIKQWEVQNNPNPFSVRMSENEKLQESMEVSRNRAKALEPLAKAYRTALSSGVLDGEIDSERKWQMEKIIETYQEQTKKAQAIEDIFRAQKDIQSGNVSGGSVSIGGQMEGVAHPMFNEGGETAPARPQLPVPSWLPNLVPELAGQSVLSKKTVAPVSGQTWLATPYSQRQGLAGYMDWSGQSYEDMLDNMAMRQTNSPRVPYSWRPATQRV